MSFSGLCRCVRFHPVAALLTAFAFVHHAMLMRAPTNDNFMHLALARQLMAGDLPIRDFFDSGLGLSYVLSAVAESIVGYRLLSEALLVGAAWALSTWLVFTLVRRLTGSTIAAALTAVLLIVASPRGYSYPKGIVYAVAATLWWAYAAKPTTARLAALGAWVAVAFYWRPDHGMYVAAGVVLALIATHGFRPRTVSRCVVAGGVTLALVAPFLVYAQVVDGLPDYVRAEIAQSVYENNRAGGHKWPLTDLPDRFLRLDAHTRASEMTAALFTWLPVLAIVIAVTPLRRRLPGIGSGASLGAFALFTVVVDVGLLRTPFDVRAVDAVVLPAVLFGCCLAALMVVARAGAGIGRWSSAVAATALVVVGVQSVAGAGGFTSHVEWIGQLVTADGWPRAFRELITTPPVDNFRDRPADASIRFAEYVRTCVPRNDRILVLWFAPEIYYYGDRLMASRHAVFVTNWAALPHEQDATLRKIARYKPPIALARRAALEAYTREAFPRVVDYVNREYSVAATVDDYPGEQYLVLTRNDRTPLGEYGPRRWPCYTPPQP
jgi:hypothetical protein